MKSGIKVRVDSQPSFLERVVHSIRCPTGIDPGTERFRCKYAPQANHSAVQYPTFRLECAREI